MNYFLYKILGIFLLLSGLAIAQEEIEVTARNADIAAQEAAISAQIAAESADRAIKLAREAAEFLGLEIEEFDTFETNPVPRLDPNEQISDTPIIVDQIPASLVSREVEASVSTRPYVEVGEPVHPPVYQDTFSSDTYYQEEYVSAKEVIAVPDHSWEISGYFRAGYLVDLNNDSDRLTYRDTVDRKESIGRIGLEVNDWWHVKAAKNFTTSNGNWGKATLSYGSTNSGLDASDFILFGGSSAKSTGLLEAFIEFGILWDDKASIWFGQRNYGRNLYSEVTDFYYTDYSGTGVGLENLPVGNGRLSVAYLNSDFSKEGWFGRINGGDTAIAFNGGVFDTEELLHTLHVGYDIGKWDFDVLAKYYPSNRSAVNEVRGVTDTGVEASAAYNDDSFYGLAEGCSTFVVQVGSGLNSGPGLGASFNTHNIFRLGALPTDFVERDSDDRSFRASTYGCFYCVDGIKITPHILFQADTGRLDRTLISGVLRGELPVTDCISLVAETGFEHVDLDDGLANDGLQYKFSVAPTLTFCSGLGETSQLSLIAAHIDGDAERGYQASESVLGLQAVVNW